MRRKRGTGTPLSQVKNVGPVTLAEMASMGLHTLEDLVQLGWEDTCRRYVLYYPERLNANAFVGVICTIEGTVWTKATAEQRKRAQQLAKLMRHELGRD